MLKKFKAFIVDKNKDQTVHGIKDIEKDELMSGNVLVEIKYSSFNFKEFTRNSSINSSTMILTRKIIKTHKFKKIQLLEDYLFKCDILRKNNTATKLNNNLAYYRILPQNRSSNKTKNLIYLWRINNKFNNLTILDNIRSVLGIMINSLKKYGFK